jgi:glycosyltransferase involved in cell wall biosynthesis
MNRLRVLLLAPDANPEGICQALIGYSQAQALAQLHDVTLVIRSSRETALAGRNGALQSVEVIRQPSLERIYAWSRRWIFKNNSESHALAAYRYLFHIAFEWQAWRQLRVRITAGEFDIVLRLLPVTSVMPSPFAFFLRDGPIPLTIGPINGGLPPSPGLSRARNQRQWISGFRNLYRYLPFARSTYRHATAIIAGSSQTYAEFAAHRDKLFFLPENGISSLYSGVARRSQTGAKLELIFVGGLVPRKACDLALRAAAPLLRDHLARFTVVGDGPERERLKQLTRSLGVEKAVSFCGYVKHDEVLQRLQSADVMVFPSLRDFGGGVVFEALSLGAVPVVVDFGGPGDIVHPEVGYKVPLTNEADVVSQIEKILKDLAGNWELVERLRKQGMSYAQECLTWEAKAQALTSIMRWALRQSPKPNLPPPKMLQLKRAS